MEHVKIPKSEFGALSGSFKDVNVAFDSSSVSDLVKNTIGKSSDSLTLLLMGALLVLPNVVKEL